MDRGARCPHSRGHRAFVHPLSSHQIVHFQCDGTLEGGCVHFLVQALLFQETFEAAAAVFVLFSLWFHSPGRSTRTT